jgi:hypothetical protein
LHKGLTNSEMCKGERKVTYGLIEMVPESKVSNYRREVVYKLIKSLTKSEMCKGGRKIIDWEIKRFSESKVE